MSGPPRNTVDAAGVAGGSSTLVSISPAQRNANCWTREALITRIGFRQTHIEYDKEPRAGGQSGWTLARKIRLVIDSIAVFSDFPIRFCAYVGAALMIASLVLGLVGPLLLPNLGAGLCLLLAAMVGLTGLQLVALGVVGDYVWRGLEEARRRPQYLIERLAGRHPVAAARTR